MEYYTPKEDIILLHILGTVISQIKYYSCGLPVIENVEGVAFLALPWQKHASGLRVQIFGVYLVCRKQLRDKGLYGWGSQEGGPLEPRDICMYVCMYIHIYIHVCREYGLRIFCQPDVYQTCYHFWPRPSPN